VNVHGSHPGRKARNGIDSALGSPSVLPEEGIPGRPLFLSLHGARAMAVSARTKMRSRLRGRRDSSVERQECQKPRLHGGTSVNTRAPFVRSGGSGRRRRETSCPSNHHAPGSSPGAEVGREPRARVPVDRLVGWQRSVGRIPICIGRSQPRGSHGCADACSRWERGERVRHVSYGTLQIRMRQTTCDANHVARVQTRPKASRLEAVCTLYGVHAPRAWSCGFSKLRDGWSRTCGACRTTSRRQRWETTRDRLFQPPRRGGSAVGRHTGS